MWCREIVSYKTEVLFGFYSHKDQITWKGLQLFLLLRESNSWRILKQKPCKPKMNYWRNRNTWSYLHRHRISLCFLSCSRKQAQFQQYAAGWPPASYRKTSPRLLHALRLGKLDLGILLETGSTLIQMMHQKRKTKLSWSWPLWERWQQRAVEEGEMTLHVTKTWPPILYWLLSCFCSLYC